MNFLRVTSYDNLGAVRLAGHECQRALLGWLLHPQRLRRLMMLSTRILQNRLELKEPLVLLRKKISAPVEFRNPSKEYDLLKRTVRINGTDVSYFVNGSVYLLFDEQMIMARGFRECKSAPFDECLRFVFGR